MKLIIGLGNPGNRYRFTRHNAGRDFMEFLASSKNLSWKKEKKLTAALAFWRKSEEDVIFAVSDLYMNESGKTVQALVHHLEIDFAKDLLVIVDDVALPFGNLRIRPQGSDGGHNGLKSIEASLGSRSYARLRLGIGATEDEPIKQALEHYVLGSFSSKERESLPGIFNAVSDACDLWLQKPMETVMSAVNSGKPRL